MQLPVCHTHITLDNQSSPEQIEYAIKHLETLLKLRQLNRDVPAGEKEIPPTPTRHEIREAHEEKIIAEMQPDPAKIFGAEPAHILAGTPIPAPPVASELPLPPVASELDAAGHAWDERIHASSRAKIADGTWRQKRGVNAGVLAAVEAERGKGPKPAAAPPIPKPPAGAAPEAGALTFGQVVAKVQAGITAGVVTQESLTSEVKTLGLASFPELAKRPDLFNALLAALGL